MTQPQRKALRLALILSGAVLLVVAGFALHGARASASTLEATLAGIPGLANRNRPNVTWYVLSDSRNITKLTINVTLATISSVATL